LHNITPGRAGDYLGQVEGSAPTKSQALAALRKFFDAMCSVTLLRSIPSPPLPASSTAVTESRTAELAIEQARTLFHSIDAGNVVGLRDRAILGVLAYTDARVGAFAKRNVTAPGESSDTRRMPRRWLGSRNRHT
jgi:site-specific recombinase XerD